MAETTEISWHFTPADYFESPTRVPLPVGVLTIADGTASYIGPAVPQSERRSALAAADAQLRTVFDSRRLITGRSYLLQAPGLVEHSADGRRTIVFFAEAHFVESEGASADLKILDHAGHVIADTKAERITSHTEYVADLSHKSMLSPVLRGMITSYANSEEDPSNALVHLYEIRDAAGKYFRGASAARDALGVTEADWQLLGRLANNEPVLEGRHRGRARGQLRNATVDELTRARAVAKRIIDAFAASTEIT